MFVQFLLLSCPDSASFAFWFIQSFFLSDSFVSASLTSYNPLPNQGLPACTHPFIHYFNHHSNPIVQACTLGSHIFHFCLSSLYQGSFDSFLTLSLTILELLLVASRAQSL